MLIIITILLLFYIFIFFIGLLSRWMNEWMNEQEGEGWMKDEWIDGNDKYFVILLNFCWFIKNLLIRFWYGDWEIFGALSLGFGWTYKLIDYWLLNRIFSPNWVICFAHLSGYIYRYILILIMDFNCKWIPNEWREKWGYYFLLEEQNFSLLDFRCYFLWIWMDL
jgi:hypothetical protein